MASVQSIRVENRNKKYKLDEKFIVKIINKILKVVGKSDARLDFLFLDDRSIRSLNKKYKNSDRATDVLSFDLGGIGAIAISLDTARVNSVRFGTKFAEEITLYIIHGMLHLFGYDDQRARDRLIMSEKERGILENLCRKEDLSRVLTRR